MMGHALRQFSILLVCFFVYHHKFAVSQTTLPVLTEPKDIETTTIPAVADNENEVTSPSTSASENEDVVDTIPTESSIMTTSGSSIEDFTLAEDEPVTNEADLMANEPEDEAPTAMAPGEDDAATTVSTTTTTEMVVQRTEDFELTSTDPKYTGSYQFQFQEMTDGSISVHCQISVDVEEDFPEGERPVVFFNRESCSNIPSINDLDGFQIATLDKHEDDSTLPINEDILFDDIGDGCLVILVPIPSDDSAPLVNADTPSDPSSSDPSSSDPSSSDPSSSDPSSSDPSSSDPSSSDPSSSDPINDNTNPDPSNGIPRGGRATMNDNSRSRVISRIGGSILSDGSSGKSSAHRSHKKIFVPSLKERNDRVQWNPYDMAYFGKLIQNKFHRSKRALLPSTNRVGFTASLFRILVVGGAKTITFPASPSVAFRPAVINIRPVSSFSGGNSAPFDPFSTFPNVQLPGIGASFFNTISVILVIIYIIGFFLPFVGFPAIRRVSNTVDEWEVPRRMAKLLRYKVDVALNSLAHNVGTAVARFKRRNDNTYANSNEYWRG